MVKGDRKPEVHMDAKSKEKGILKLEPRQRNVIESKTELTPQGSCDRPPPSPQPSVDRLSVTWADPSSMTSSGVNLFHIPSETPITNEVKFSPTAADVSEDEDYSASLSAVLRQRRASVRRSRKGRTRRPSSPFLADENRSRRRSSIFTTSSGDTAISIDETPLVTQEQIFENIHLHKEVLGSVKQQPLGMRRKLKIVHQAKGYIKRHEGQLQERLAQSKSTRDIYARFNILMASKWQQLKREAANISNLLIPWELRIKEIESHFGSVVASYFTFLRWLFWVNLVIGFNLLVFVIIPEYLTANPLEDGERKIIMKEEQRNSTNLLTVWEFEGVLKYSPIFYGYYSNVDRPEYRMPLAYFLTGLVVYIYSFVAILRKMAENSRMSKLSEKEDECIFSWKLFTGWDFMIGNTETAHNRIASVTLGFKEALLEEAEKKKDPRNWRIIWLRALVNILVIALLGASAYAVVTVVTRSDDNSKVRSWWRENETTTVVTVISITFPVFFEALGLLEHCHPRKQLRLQLARIMLLNLLNLYSLIFALFNKIEGMSNELDLLQPSLNMNAAVISENTLDISESLINRRPVTCPELAIPCLPCHSLQFSETTITDFTSSDITTTDKLYDVTTTEGGFGPENLKISNDNEQNALNYDLSTTDSSLLVLNELYRLRNISNLLNDSTDFNETTYDYDNDNGYYENSSFQPITLSTFTQNGISTVETTFFNTDIYDEISSVTGASTDVTSLQSTTDNVADHSTDLITVITDENYTNLDITTSRIEWDNESETTTHDTEETNKYISSTTEHSFPSSSDKVIDNKNNNRNSNLGLTSTTNYNGNKMISDHEITTEVTNLVELENITNAESTTTTNQVYFSRCPNVSFNYSVNCGDKNITKVFFITNCTISDVKCYVKKCDFKENDKSKINVMNNTTAIDRVYYDKNNRKMYNLTKATQKKLLKLCWETMFGQELVKLTMMDLVFVLLGTLFMDFFRALFVRYMNRCWCWDLEKKFPEYGDFKIAENILHLINNQGMVWMGMFFSPGLVVLNVFKLIIMMYLRSWAVMTCNVPHEVVFRVSKSNNFYLALLLTMLFLCVLPVGYTIVWVKPSWHCGPFSEYEKIYHILTNNIYKILPKSLNFALEYIASPAIVIPLLVLLVLIIYYLTSLTNSLREANNDLKIQLRRERTEERRKMFQLADTRRRTGSSAIDSTPFSRWKKALPSLPLSKSIESDDRKTGDEIKEPAKRMKGKGGIFAKIVALTLDKKPEVCMAPSTQSADDETDTDFHETLPKEILKNKNITITRHSDLKKKPVVEFKSSDSEIIKNRSEQTCLKVKLEKSGERTDKKAVLEKLKEEKIVEEDAAPTKTANKDLPNSRNDSVEIKFKKKQTSESSTYSRQSDSISSVIPVITISTTESDDEIPKEAEMQKNVANTKTSSKNETVTKNAKKSSSDLKSLQRQSSVDSINDNKPHNKKKSDDGHKYQYSL